MTRHPILISGGGIAGLTLAILLKQRGFTPLVVEREPALRREGYMMDFFGTGWDVAERMNLVPALRAIRYPIEAVEFVGGDGKPYCRFPIDRLRRALDDKYVYLRRPDLERILFERAQAAGVAIRFATSAATLDQGDNTVRVRFADGSEDEFALVIGADGVHSGVRDLAFGPEAHFARFLGYYVAAFHFPTTAHPLDRALELYEEPDRAAWLYPLDRERADATFIFRHDDVGAVEPQRCLPMLAEAYRDAGWGVPEILREAAAQKLFFDSLTQIVMPQWHRGRVALIGDACGCLTLTAGQGSHMAMAGAYVLANELSRHGGDHRAAFAAYQEFLAPHVAAKQRDAARFARMIVPSRGSRPWLRRLAIRLMFNPLIIAPAMRFFGSRSVLADYAAA